MLWVMVVSCRMWDQIMVRISGERLEKMPKGLGVEKKLAGWLVFEDI